ncbi:MAG: hypothetical protein L6V79_06945 [Clostridium sp.]|nr:MAG: hypothetical protein L6V79_06945 [Clostridium sp.]
MVIEYFEKLEEEKQMTSHDYFEIKKLLFGVMSKANKYESLEERRDFFIIKHLSVILIFLDLDEPLDIRSSDVAELISNEFLTIQTEEPHIFEATGFCAVVGRCKKKILHGIIITDMKNI